MVTLAAMEGSSVRAPVAGGPEVVRRVVVLGDSLSYWTPDGPHRLTDPAIFPNRLAADLSRVLHQTWIADIVARQGMSVREMSSTLPVDAFLQEVVLARADLVVIGIGSRDSWAVALPTPIGVGLSAAYRTPRPIHLRKSHVLQRVLVRATGSRLRFTPRPRYEDAYRRLVRLVRRCAPGAVVCAILPSIPFGPQPYFHFSPRHHADTADATRAVAAELNLPLIDAAAMVRSASPVPHGDCTHWPLVLHDEIARAVQEAVVPLLRRPTSAPAALA